MGQHPLVVFPHRTEPAPAPRPYGWLRTHGREALAGLSQKLRTMRAPFSGRALERVRGRFCSAALAH